MKATDLIIDQYYVTQYKKETDSYIFKNIDMGKKGDSIQPYLRPCSNYFSHGNLDGKTNESFRDEEYRSATWDEIRHLDACIAASSYVDAPKPLVINQYEIY